MSEYREALQNLVTAVEKDCTVEAIDPAYLSIAFDRAKALLSRPEPEQIPLQIDSRPDGCWLLTSPDHPGLMLAGKDLAQLLADTGNSFRILMKLDRESVEPAAAEKARELFTLEEWNESDGEVLWWRFPIVEPPYVGSPVCSDWPWDEDEEGDHVDHYTHWTRIPLPSPPAATGEKCNHDLQLPGHTINVLGPLDAVCKVCKEEWHLPGDKK